MAELNLTEEEKEKRSYLNWDDETLGKYVKKKAIEHEDYYGQETSEREAAVVTLLSDAKDASGDMVMMEVEGLTINGEDLGRWRITFEKVNPDLPNNNPGPTGSDDEETAAATEGYLFHDKN